MNCKLNSDAVMKASRAVGVLYSLIDLRFRWYCLIRYSSKLLGRVAQLTEKDKRENEGHEPEGNELSVRKRNNMN